MARQASCRDLIGKRIVAVEMRPFNTGKGYMTSDPIIILDDGSTLTFVVEEVEDGSCYGVVIIRHPKSRSKRR